MKFFFFTITLIFSVYVLAQQQPAAMGVGLALNQLYALLDILTRGDVDAFASFVARLQETGVAVPNTIIPIESAVQNTRVILPLITSPNVMPTQASSQISPWTPAITLPPTMTVTYEATSVIALTLPTTGTTTHLFNNASTRSPVTRNVTVTVYPTLISAQSSVASWTAAVATIYAVLLTSSTAAITLYLSG